MIVRLHAKDIMNVDASRGTVHLQVTVYGKGGEWERKEERREEKMEGKISFFVLLI